MQMQPSVSAVRLAMHVLLTDDTERISLCMRAPNRYYRATFSCDDIIALVYLCKLLEPLSTTLCRCRQRRSHKLGILLWLIFTRSHQIQGSFSLL